MDDLGWSDELTDLTPSEDESGVPPVPATSHRATRTSTRLPKAKYAIRESLEPSRTVTYSVEWLYQQLSTGRIDVCPDYQRGIVWSDAKQSYLIESIHRNMLTTPIIFCVKTRSDGAKVRVCIDGKQRLTSIKRFLEAEIPHRDSYTDEKLWSQQPRGKMLGRKVLSDEIMQDFRAKGITCIEFNNITEDQEREVFQRVQLGVPLSPAERMQAINGEWPTFVRSLNASITIETRGFMKWNEERGRDFHSIAVVVALVCRDKKSTWPSPATLEKMLERPDSVPERVRMGMREAVSALVLLAKSPAGKCLKSPERLAPVEFVTAMLLVYKYRAQLGLTRLGAAVTKLRTRIRGRFKTADLKCNSHVLRFAHQIIVELKQTDLGGDGAAEVPVTQLLAQVDADAMGDSDAEPVAPPPMAKHRKARLAPKAKQNLSSGNVSGDDADSEDRVHASSSARSSRKHIEKPTKVKESNIPSVMGKRKRSEAEAEDASDSDSDGQPLISTLKRALKPAASAASRFKASSRTVKQTPVTKQATAFYGLRHCVSAPIVDISTVATDMPTPPGATTNFTELARSQSRTSSIRQESTQNDKVARRGTSPTKGEELGTIGSLPASSTSSWLPIPASLNPRGRPLPASTLLISQRTLERAVQERALPPPPPPQHRVAGSVPVIPAEPTLPAGWLRAVVSHAQTLLPGARSQVTASTPSTAQLAAPWSLKLEQPDDARAMISIPTLTEAAPLAIASRVSQVQAPRSADVHPKTDTVSRSHTQPGPASGIFHTQVTQQSHVQEQQQQEQQKCASSLMPMRFRAAALMGGQATPQSEPVPVARCGAPAVQAAPGSSSARSLPAHLAASNSRARNAKTSANVGPSRSGSL